MTLETIDMSAPRKKARGGSRMLRIGGKAEGFPQRPIEHGLLVSPVAVPNHFQVGTLALVNCGPRETMNHQMVIKINPFQ
jgi:hypothetical protein